MPHGTITIAGLRIFARHGVFEQETAGGNVFELDIRLSYPCREAMESDSLASALNYGEVVGLAQEVIAQPSKLLEHCVGRLQRAITDRYPFVSGGRIALRKLRPPIEAELSSVGFEYEW